MGADVNAKCANYVFFFHAQNRKNWGKRLGWYETEATIENNPKDSNAGNKNDDEVNDNSKLEIDQNKDNQHEAETNIENKKASDTNEDHPKASNDGLEEDQHKKTNRMLIILELKSSKMNKWHMMKSMRREVSKE